MSYGEIADLVQRNNHSGLTDQLIICMLWNESNFNPAAGSGRPNIGSGLAGVTCIATQQVNSNYGFTVYLYENWSDPSWSVDVGTRYLNWALTRITDGDVTAALQRYGTGDTYPAGQIQDCENCLKTGSTSESTKCSRANPQDCLNKVHK